MVVPTIQQLAKKSVNNPPNKIYAIDDDEVKVDVKQADKVVWGAWSSGLCVAVISAFIFPFIGVPAIIVAMFAYVDHKSGDTAGYLRKRQIARRLGVAALIVGIIMMGMMMACKLRRRHRDREHHENRYRGMVKPGPYCHRPHSDCYGRDLRHVQGVTLGQCQQECDWMNLCRSIQHNGESCWLKRHQCSAAELTLNSRGHDYVKVREGVDCNALHDEFQKIRDIDYCSRPGVTCSMNGNYCHRPDSDCMYHDFNHMKVNLQQCLAACDAEPRCKSIQHHDNNCWIKDTTCDNKALTLVTGRQDYVKRAVAAGQTCTGL